MNIHFLLEIWLAVHSLSEPYDPMKETAYIAARCYDARVCTEMTGSTILGTTDKRCDWVEVKRISPKFIGATPVVRCEYVDEKYRLVLTWEYEVLR